MDIRQLIKTKAAPVKYHLSHLKPGYLFRTRIPRLCPVVGLDENVIIVYGRYDVYNENNEVLTAYENPTKSKEIG